MKLEVGMYVRLENDVEDIVIINKIANVFETTILTENDGSIYQGVYTKENVIKASYNIIDILEKGDVIIDKEGHKYPINYEFETDYNGEYKSYEITIDDHITLFLKDGLSIVTHEQMEQMAYKVGEYV
jgi:hypothetical protein